MADVELKHSRIAGIAACVPQQIDRIEDYIRKEFTKELKKIKKLNKV